MGEQETVTAVSFESVAAELRTGDLMLLHGHAWESAAVEDATRSFYSHVAMVVRPHAEAPPLIWEAGPNPLVEDPDTKTRHGGAQLGAMVDVLKLVGGGAQPEQIFIRRLAMNRDDALERGVVQSIADLDGTPFPTLWQMTRDWALGRFHIPTSSKRAFCAELVAETYTRMGLLPKEPPANSYEPKTFSTENPHLRLLLGAKLLEQVQVAAPPATASSAAPLASGASSATAT